MRKVKHLIVPAMLLAAAWALPAAADVANNTINSPARITERVKPDAKVCVEGDAACGVAAAPAAAAGGAKRSADDIFNNICAGCHMTGAAGAPKAGDKAAWGPRIAQGKETLYKHALGGFNMMPAKGTCGDCSDDEIKSVVDLIVSKAK